MAVKERNLSEMGADVLFLSGLSGRINSGCEKRGIE
jgi:hypothetical protein